MTHLSGLMDKVKGQILDGDSIKINKTINKRLFFQKENALKMLKKKEELINKTF